MGLDDQSVKGLILATMILIIVGPVGFEPTTKGL